MQTPDFLASISLAYRGELVVKLSIETVAQINRARHFSQLENRKSGLARSPCVGIAVAVKWTIKLVLSQVFNNVSVAHDFRFSSLRLACVSL